MKTISLLTIILVSWLAYACSTSDGKENAIMDDADSVPVGIMTLHREKIPVDIHASGQFTTNAETFLSFKSGGVIEKIFVKEGERIHKGQLLASLNLAEIDAGVAQAQLGYEKSKRDFERVGHLYHDSVATLEQFQNSRTAMELATQQLAAARFNRQYAEIHAVEDGFVLRKVANEGQVVSTGAPVLQTNSGSQGNWVLKVGLSDREWTMITIGDPAEIEIDAIQGHPFAAKVVRLSEGTDPYTGSFSAELQLTHPGDIQLASGLFGKAHIKPAQSKEAWSIPYDALLDGDAQSGFVFVTNDNKTAQQVKVDILSIGTDQILVSHGLEDARAIIVSGSAYLKDQSNIRVIAAPVSTSK